MQPMTMSAPEAAAPPAPRAGSWKAALLECEELRARDAPVRARREALLGYVAPGGPRPGSEEVLASLDAEGWADVVEYAMGPWTRMGPLAYSALNAGGLRDHVPSDGLERLHASYLRTGKLNVQRRADLAAVLGRLNANGVPVGVLKGPYMVEYVYSDPNARKMADIDLFIPRGALEEAERTILAMGYGPEAVWRPSIAWSLASSLSIPQYERTGATIVSVHWNIEDPRGPFPIDVDALWSRTQPVRLAGEPARVLAPEDYLLHLCLHASYRHGFETPMRCYYDLALMTAHFTPRLDWDVFVERAGEWRCTRPAFAALDVARRLFAAAVPGPVVARLSATPLDRHVARVAGDHVVRGARAGSPVWGVTRRVLDAWLRDVAGAWPRPDW